MQIRYERFGTNRYGRLYDVNCGEGAPLGIAVVKRDGSGTFHEDPTDQPGIVFEDFDDLTDYLTMQYSPIVKP